MTGSWSVRRRIPRWPLPPYVYEEAAHPSRVDLLVLETAAAGDGGRSLSRSLADPLVFTAAGGNVYVDNVLSGTVPA